MLNITIKQTLQNVVMQNVNMLNAIMLRVTIIPIFSVSMLGIIIQSVYLLSVLKLKMLFCCNAIIPSAVLMRVMAPKFELKCWNIKMKNKAFSIKNILEIQVLNRQK
jgi:hypothetical protein